MKGFIKRILVLEIVGLVILNNVENNDPHVSRDCFVGLCPPRNDS